eukprot:2600255-Rhodomonas_salina.2
MCALPHSESVSPPLSLPPAPIRSRGQPPTFGAQRQSRNGMRTCRGVRGSDLGSSAFASLGGGVGVLQGEELPPRLKCQRCPQRRHSVPPKAASHLELLEENDAHDDQHDKADASSQAVAPAPLPAPPEQACHALRAG